jgi:NADH-quinone oxidoreductase subunit J
MTFFLILAAIAVLSAFGVIFNKNVVHSALFLLVNFCTIAVLYFTLNAQFLGIAQVLIYAGAVVVLFLFVVMLLGADLGEPVKSWLTGRNIGIVGLCLIMLTIIGTAVFENSIYGAQGSFTGDIVQQAGQTQALGLVLFTRYLVPFQLVAVLLSVGVIGVVWLAQHQQRQKLRTVIAVLDAGWHGEAEQKDGDVVRVNWLSHQVLFDFDSVEIIDATVEDVQRFVNQISHDTDDWRNSRYRQMNCRIEPGCVLSADTMQVLRDMFAAVSVAERVVE